MRTNKILPMLALVPMITIAAGSAFAQAPAGGARADGNPPPRPPMARFCDDMAARGAAKLAYLQEKLQLRADQQQAWTTFATQSKAAAEPMRRLCADMPTPPAPPPAPAQGEARAPRPVPDAATMLGHRERMLTAQLESVKLMRGAVDAFAPTLSPEQKETFNRLAMRAAMDRGFEKMRKGKMHRHSHHGMHRHGPHSHGPHGHGPQSGPEGRGPASEATPAPRGPAR